MAYTNEDKAKVLGYLLSGYSVETAVNELARHDYDRYGLLSSRTVSQWIKRYGWKNLIKTRSLIDAQFKSFLPIEVRTLSKDLQEIREKTMHKLKSGEYKIQSFDKAITGLAQLFKLELQLSGIDLTEMRRSRILEIFKEVLAEDEVIGDLIRERWPDISARIREKLIPDKNLLEEETDGSTGNCQSD